MPSVAILSTTEPVNASAPAASSINAFASGSLFCFRRTEAKVRAELATAALLPVLRARSKAS